MMDYEEILEMINKKGEVAKTTFNSIMDMNNEEIFYQGFETVGTFAFNCTALLLKLIAEKPSYYKEAFKLTQIELDDALKDNESMPHLYYPDEILKIQRLSDLVDRDMQDGQLDNKEKQCE